MWASVNGRTAVVELLLQVGANTEAKDSTSVSTALIKATRNGFSAIVEQLLEGGANKEAKSTYNSVGQRSHCYRRASP
jgi:ankyrin repeat protein